MYASVACQLFWACNVCWPCRTAVLAFVTPLLPRLRYLPVSVSVLRGAPVKIVYHLILSAEIQVSQIARLLPVSTGFMLQHVRPEWNPGGAQKRRHAWTP